MTVRDGFNGWLHEWLAFHLTTLDSSHESIAWQAFNAGAAWASREASVEELRRRGINVPARRFAQARQGSE